MIAYKTDVYSYNQFMDQLQSINGQSIIYDQIGNQLSNGEYDYKYVGRQLSAVNKDSNNDNIYEQVTEFTYNADGIRNHKWIRIPNEFGGSYDFVSTNYHLSGNKIMVEEIFSGTSTSDVEFSTTIYYMYDEIGRPISMTVDKDGILNTYYYIVNLQGDIVSIVNGSGTILAEYYYDAYGNILNKDTLTDIGRLNPFRYRGYYYDSEVGLYYCNARYYNPEIGRFISTDDVGYLDPSNVNGLNLYTYCGNNPVMFYDPTGEIAITTIILIIAICSGVGMFTYTASLLHRIYHWKWQSSSFRNVWLQAVPPPAKY